MIDAKKIILGGVAALALFFSISLYASSSQKIGILDTAALEDSNQFKEIRDKLSKEFQPVQDELAKKQKTLEEKYKAFQKEKDLLSASQKTAKEKEMNKLQQEMQEIAAKANESYQKRNQEELSGLQTALNKIIDEIAEKEKYDLVLPKNAAVFVKKSDEKNSFTNKVIAKLDKDFKNSISAKK